MKSTTKWVIGILVGVVLVAALVAVGYLVFERWAGPAWEVRAPSLRPWEGGRGMPMQPFQDMPHLRIVRYSPLRFIGGGLIFVGMLVLIGLGIAALVRSLRRPLPAAAPASLIPQAGTQTCPNCNRPVQADWLHCPYCASDLKKT